MDAAEPGFADKFRTPDSRSQTALLTAGESVVLELAKPGVPAKFIALGSHGFRRPVLPALQTG